MEFKCERCGDDFTCKRNLIGHLLRYKDCLPSCENAPTRTELYTKINTKILNEVNFPCKYCQEKFNTKSAMYKHSARCKQTTHSTTLHVSNVKGLKASEQVTSLQNELSETKKKLYMMEAANEELLKRLEMSPSDMQPIKLAITIAGKEKGLPKKKIPGSLRIACWEKWIGKQNGTHLCICCNQHTISTFDFHCGHIIADCNGGGISLDNLRPICASCNLSMSSMNMKEFAKTYFNHDIVE